MASYIYFKQENQPLDQRFSPSDGLDFEIIGLSEWQESIALLLSYLSNINESNRPAIRQFVQAKLRDYYRRKYENNRDDYDFNQLSTEELIAIWLLKQLRDYPPLPSRNQCPRLFISHRQTDQADALRVASVALDQHFDIWLDILDPQLNAIATFSSLSAKLLSILTVCIIEMGIINCSHVIMCLTPNTKGTMWQPYEYGRITEIPGVYRKAAVWRHPGLQDPNFPEYLYLGIITRTKAEIETWLSGEFAIWGTDECKLRVKDILTDIKIEPWPEEEHLPANKEDLTNQSWFRNEEQQRYRDNLF